MHIIFNQDTSDKINLKTFDLRVGNKICNGCMLKTPPRACGGNGTMTVITSAFTKYPFIKSSCVTSMYHK